MKSNRLFAVLVCAMSSVAAFAEGVELKTIEVGGGEAVGLAAVVADALPGYSAQAKADLNKILADSCEGAGKAKSKKITLSADRVACSVSNIAVGSFRCTVSAKNSSVEVSGRKGHELYATLLAAGVFADGAMGKTVAVAEELKCAFAPKQIAGCDGAWEAAKCSFKAYSAE